MDVVASSMSHDHNSDGESLVYDNKLDSHTNMIVSGSNRTIIKETDKTVDVKQSTDDCKKLD